MRGVLADRPIGYRPPESHLEARVQRILREAGLPPFDRQVDVGDDDGWIARVDFLCRPLRVIVFVDGDRWHSGLVDRLGDRPQQTRLERTGFIIVRVPESMVFTYPRALVDMVRASIGPIGRAG
jgi:very-short-patch-repair endonuclease